MTKMDRIAQADIERLSAYLDRELNPGDAEQLEARLASDQELSSALAALRATAEVVGSLPEVRLPRSFALTQDMVRSRRTYPILQLTAAAAALGFVLVLGADLLFSSAAGVPLGASEQDIFAADQLAEQQLADPASAPALEEGITERIEGALALPEAESVGEAEDGLAQGFLRSDDQATDAELVEESAAAPEAGGLPEESGAEPGESDESSADLEAASGADQDAFKAAPEEDSSDGRVKPTEPEFSDEKPSMSLNLFRVIEIGLAAALIVLFGLTLWVRQRG